MKEGGRRRRRRRRKSARGREREREREREIQCASRATGSPRRQAPHYVATKSLAI